MAESSCRAKSRKPLAFKSASRLVVPLPASGSAERSNTSTSPPVWLHQLSANRPASGVHPLPKARLQVPEPGTSAPVGPVKNRAIRSLQQISPHGLSRMVTRASVMRSEEHTSELQSLAYLVCRLLLEK